MTGEVFYFYYDDDSTGNRVALVNSMMAEPTPENGPFVVTPAGESMSKADHANAVAKVKQDIIEGKIFQCEVGFKKWFDIEGDTINLYEQLREVNPSPQMYYIKFAEQKVIGASPELLFRVRQGGNGNLPLAGTAKRGKDAAEDTCLSARLIE